MSLRTTIRRLRAEAMSLSHHALQLLVLTVGTSLAFLGTRTLANAERAARVRDADAWYAIGQRALADGHPAVAADAYRRALVRVRDDKRYGIGLARASFLDHDTDAAWNALASLREATPEDADLNVELARLAAARDDVPTATRLYHNALYAPWPADSGATRRQVRIELITFLLAHDRASSAQAELLALTADLPDTAADHLQVAALFAAAGDHPHALEHYQRSVRLAPDNADALAGVGREAFQLGQYALARDMLRRAPSDAPDVQALRDVTEQLLSSDPLAPRLGAAERRRRLLDDLRYVQDRWTTCAARVPVNADETSIAHDLDMLITHPSALSVSQDAVESAIDLIDRALRGAVARCGPQTPRDRALQLIARHANGGA